MFKHFCCYIVDVFSSTRPSLRVQTSSRTVFQYILTFVSRDERLASCARVTKIWFVAQLFEMGSVFRKPDASLLFCFKVFWSIDLQWPEVSWKSENVYIYIYMLLPLRKFIYFLNYAYMFWSWYALVWLGTCIFLARYFENNVTKYHGVFLFML